MAKTITEGFQKFLAGLQPVSSEVAKAKSHKGSVEGSLRNQMGCYRFEEIGSVGNGTGIRHHSDTDYFASITVDKLSVNSSTALRDVKKALQHTFHNTSGIVVNNPAVAIPFGIYASEHLEVTPAQFKGMITTDLGTNPLYLIADGNGGWMKASPMTHNRYVQKVNEKLQGKLKPVIQLVKAWKYYNNVPIISFHLELRITKLFENSIILHYDEAVYMVLRHLHKVELAGINDPMKISGLIRASQTEAQEWSAFSKLETALTRAEKAVQARMKNNPDKAFEYWNKLFNQKFPAR